MRCETLNNADQFLDQFSIIQVSARKLNHGKYQCMSFSDCASHSYDVLKQTCPFYLVENTTMFPFSTKNKHQA